MWEPVITGKVTPKEYQCSNCHNIKTINTNHNGSCLDTCTCGGYPVPGLKGRYREFICREKLCKYKGCNKKAIDQIDLHLDGTLIQFDC